MTFNTPFGDALYAVECTPWQPADDVFMEITAKDANGFSVYSCDDGGMAEANVDFDWTATPYYDP